jgi:CheY-like chemotaxis protein
MRKVASARTEEARARPLDVILYVEDEDDNWEVAKMRLGRSYELIRAANDEAACDVLRARGSEISAILMDVQLKGSKLDGIRLTQLLRGQLPLSEQPAYARGIPPLRTPLIFVTAYNSKYSETDLVGIGGDLMLPKPVNFVTLTVALTNLTSDRTLAPRTL